MFVDVSPLFLASASSVSADVATSAVTGCNTEFGDGVDLVGFLDLESFSLEFGHVVNSLVSIGVGVCVLSRAASSLARDVRFFVMLVAVSVAVPPLLMPFFSFLAPLFVAVCGLSVDVLVERLHFLHT